jgi:hypothetical protein
MLGETTVKGSGTGVPAGMMTMNSPVATHEWLASTTGMTSLAAILRRRSMLYTISHVQSWGTPLTSTA